MKKSKKALKSRPFDKFVAILDKNFKTYDKRYNKIVDKNCKDKNG